MTIRITWEKYGKIAENMAESLKNQTFDRIIGISRSGLVLAVHLSHLLGVRNFGSVSVYRTTSDNQYARKQLPRISHCCNIENLKSKYVLIVDDIIGEGQTISVVKDMLQQKGAEITTAILVVNLNNYKGENIDELANIIGLKVDDWVTFPWECISDT